MTYACGDFIYGWDLTKPEEGPDPYAAHRAEISDLEDDGVLDGMWGNNDTPVVYLGVVTGGVAEYGRTPVQDVIEALTVKPENLKEFADVVAMFESDTTISQGLKDAIAAQPISHFLAWTHS